MVDNILLDLQKVLPFFNSIAIRLQIACDIAFNNGASVEQLEPIQIEINKLVNSVKLLDSIK